MKALQQGIEPTEPHARSVAVRPGDFMLPRDVTPMAGGASDILLVRR